jgi:HK97 family phage prohead protease
MQERRFFNTRVELRDSQGDEPALIGYACRFSAKGNRFGISSDLGGFRERIAAGCFSRSLASGKNDVKMLRDHEPSLILGRQANKTLEVSEDNFGLRFACRLNMRTTIGVDAYELVRSGTVSECSFAFQVDPGGEDWTSEDVDGVDTPLRIIRSAQLFDCSIVSQPAYPDSTSAQIAAIPASVMGRNFPET